MGSGIKLKNAQDQECHINHPDNAGAINLNSNEIASKLLSPSVTPGVNSTMEFQLTNNTTLTIKVKGTDGIIRTSNITLA